MTDVQKFNVVNYKYENCDVKKSLLKVRFVNWSIISMEKWMSEFIKET